MKMSENIKYLRLKNNMTQEQLGNVIGVQKSAIRKYESGMVQNIPRSSIKKMAEIFNVSPSYLMGFEEEKETPDEPQLTEGERFMLEIFRQIPEEQQQVFLEMGRVYANSLKKD